MIMRARAHKFTLWMGESGLWTDSFITFAWKFTLWITFLASFIFFFWREFADVARLLLHFSISPQSSSCVCFVWSEEIKRSSLHSTKLNYERISTWIFPHRLTSIDISSVQSLQCCCWEKMLLIAERAGKFNWKIFLWKEAWWGCSNVSIGVLWLKNLLFSLWRLSELSALIGNLLLRLFSFHWMAMFELEARLHWIVHVSYLVFRCNILIAFGAMHMMTTMNSIIFRTRSHCRLSLSLSCWLTNILMPFCGTLILSIFLCAATVAGCYAILPFSPSQSIAEQSSSFLRIEKWVSSCQELSEHTMNEFGGSGENREATAQQIHKIRNNFFFQPTPRAYTTHISYTRRRPQWGSWYERARFLRFHIVDRRRQSSLSPRPPPSYIIKTFSYCFNNNLHHIAAESKKKKLKNWQFDGELYQFL